MIDSHLAQALLMLRTCREHVNLSDHEAMAVGRKKAGWDTRRD